MFANFKSNMPWLESCTILLVKAGSHAYGTNTPTSDEDFRGIAIPPEEYFLGYSKVFEQAIATTPDLCIYDIRKWFKLAANGNPNVIEVVWTDPSDWVSLISPFSRKLIDNRELFLSRQVKHTYSGYAMSQAKRIKLHRRYLLNPITKPPVRADFGLKENRSVPKSQMEAAMAAIRKRLDAWEPNLDGLDPATITRIMSDLEKTVLEVSEGVTKFQAAAGFLGFDSNFIELMAQERLFKQAQDDWDHYQTWLKERNPVRAEMEARFGYDGKHASHLVRLYRQGQEILEGKGVIVKRPDAQELLAIRNGAWTYEQLMEWVEGQDATLDALYSSSKLPKVPPHNEIDRLCVELVQEMNG